VPLTLTHAALTADVDTTAPAGAWVPYSTLNLLLSALGGDLDEPEFRALHSDLRDLVLGEEG
jgi:hypothetical protein